MHCERVLDHFLPCHEDATETVYYPVLGGMELSYCAKHAEDARREQRKKGYDS